MNDEVTKPLPLAIRTKKFALRIIRLSDALPRRRSAEVIGRQILRSGTSVGAQYREGHRARSTAEFISKLESSIQELSETQYWLELLAEGGIVADRKLHELMQEAEELMAILVSSVITVKKKSKK